MLTYQLLCENTAEDREKMISTQIHTHLGKSWERKFKNIDQATCWLNACLQLLLTAIDHSSPPPLFTSELGRELIRLKLNE